MGSGEYITIDEMLFVIKKKDIEGAAKALLNNLSLLNITDNKPDDISWTARLKQLMSDAGWEPEFDSMGDDIEFLQYNLSSYDDLSSTTDDFFNILAPYVLPDSFIQVHGEGDGGSTWRWIFNGHTCERKYARLDYHGYGKIVQAILKLDNIATFMGIHEDLDKLIAEKLGDTSHEFKPVLTADMLLKSLDRKPNWNRTELVNELGIEPLEGHNW